MSRIELADGALCGLSRTVAQSALSIWIPAILILFLGAASSAGQSLSNKQAVEVTAGVQKFARAVAHDVTAEGPSAWRRHFADTASFFMASEGRLVFPNSAAATAAIQKLARTIKKIELRWGDELRVDPLTPTLAVLATTYHETRQTFAGQNVEEDGYFTGVVEYRSGRWQFRDAHWSVVGPALSIP